MKTVIKTKSGEKKKIPISAMQPCQVGWCNYNNEEILVMRTALKDRFEVMDLTNFRVDSCWSGGSCLLVELITEPVSVTFIP